MRNLRQHISIASMEAFDSLAVKVFIVGGTSMENLEETLVKSIKGEVGFMTGMGLETQQMEEVKEDGKLNVYVVTPSKVGFSATAAMTVDAMRNPENTVIALVEGEGDALTEEEKAESASVKKLFEDQGAHVFDNVEDMSAYVNKSISENADDDGTPEEDAEGDEEVDTGDEEVDEDDTSGEEEESSEEDESGSEEEESDEKEESEEKDEKEEEEEDDSKKDDEEEEESDDKEEEEEEKD